MGATLPRQRKRTLKVGQRAAETSPVRLPLAFPAGDAHHHLSRSVYEAM